MHPLTFSGYSPGSQRVTIIAERIVDYYRIDYNGNPGSKIELDNGKEICVSESPETITRMILELK